MNTESRLGSVRMMRAVNPGIIAQQYTNFWSAFDRGTSTQPIPYLGEARCACAVKSFLISESVDQPTHFLRQVDPYTIMVEEYEVPGKPSLSGRTEGRIADAEWIWRTHVKGSLFERLTAGTVKPEALGFAPGTTIVDGMKLPKMIKECTTKYEKVDRHLSSQEAYERVGMTELQWERAWNLVERIVHVTSRAYEKAGFYCPDGKMELAIGNDGEIYAVDVFGTQDENRIIDIKTGEIHSKDLIRIHLMGLPWYDELKAAKSAYPDDKDKWPMYPTLPDSLVELVSLRYRAVALRYGGVKIG